MGFLAHFPSAQYKPQRQQCLRAQETPALARSILLAEEIV